MSDPTPFSTRLFWLAIALVVLAVAWHGLTRLTGDAPDIAHPPGKHQLEQHRDRLIDHATDVGNTIENAG